MEISFQSINACRETLAAGLAIQRAGWRGGVDPADHVDMAGLPETIKVSVHEAWPVLTEALDPVALRLLHEEVLDLAWRQGAWNVQVLRHPPHAGHSHNYPDAKITDVLNDAAERGTLVSWSWRPMLNGPKIRRIAHAAKDCTLDPDGGRRSARPEFRAIDWTRTGGMECVIRLGQPSDAHLPPPPRPPRGPGARATGAQRGYIVALRKRCGRAGEPLPAALTRAEASTIIDDLLAGGAHP